MQYTVTQLARLAGVTPRTLRHYDHLGLLCPARWDNRYRCYGPNEVNRLQQILFYREAGLSLEQIAQILDSPGFGAQEAMSEHLQNLIQRRDELDALIQTARRTLATLKGEETMQDNDKFTGFKTKLVEDNENKYGNEVRSRWGNDAANAANAKIMNMSEGKYEAFTLLSEELNECLAQAVKTGDPSGNEGQTMAALHRDWLNYTWPKYSLEAHKSLAQMYVDDERFAAYYEKIAPGAAAFLRDAITIFVDRQA